MSNIKAPTTDRPTREECIQKAGRVLARAILRIEREKFEAEAAGECAGAA